MATTTSDRGHEAWPPRPLQPRGDRDAREHRQAEADNQPEPRRRAQPGKHRHRPVERRVQDGLRPERRPERQQRQPAVERQELAAPIAAGDPDAPAAEDQRHEARKRHFRPGRQVAQHPGVRVRRARQVVAPVRRDTESRPSARAERRRRWNREVRQERRRHEQDRDGRRDADRDPEARAAPQPARRRDDDDREARPSGRRRRRSSRS